MHISDMNISQTGLFSGGLAAEGMGSGCVGKILEIKLGVKSQQAVGNVRVES
jgi:hypothetical protein